ncbi:MAG: addiction module protein [Bifidobacteriaceae bacterium]|jgi:hypothetical protein|nr:addiction module protein [Bifidobacteriaceae bacterium]
MVSVTLQEHLGALTMAERVDVIDLLERSLISSESDLTEEEKSIVRQRDAEMDADPSLGLSWEELDARLQDKWG